MTYPIIPAADKDHLQQVAHRIEDLQDSGRAQARALRIEAALDVASETRLFNQAHAAPTSTKKLLWLQRAADVVVRAADASGAAACRDGCAHCCHIPVMITAAEARSLTQPAKVLGRSFIEAPARSVALSMEDVRSGVASAAIDELREGAAAAYTGSPCPFLKDSRCSVYNDRPLACRYQVSLDDDDLLCRLVEPVEGASVRVPYLDNLQRMMTAAVILGPSQRIADIRDWFPKDVPAEATVSIEKVGRAAST